jgi:hypothetical protein
MDLANAYRKQTHREHILSLPDTYIGSIETAPESVWLRDGEGNFVNENIPVNPGFYKLVDELLVNAHDHVIRLRQRGSETPVKHIAFTCDGKTVSIENDGDPIDVLVLVSHPTFPGCIVEVTPIGVLEMTDDKGPDEKILCVANKDPRYGYRRSITELNDHTLKEISHFFRVYKDLEDKYVEVRNWHDRDVAIDIIKKYRLV